MKLNDILSLAKAGYKKKEISDLIALENAENIENSTNQVSAEPVNTSETPSDTSDGADIPVSAPNDESSTDYKLLYDELKKTLETTQQALKDAQKINSSATVTGLTPQNPSEKTMQILTDVAKSFM